MDRYVVIFTDMTGDQHEAVFDALNEETAQEMFCAEFGDNYAIEDVYRDDQEYDELMDGDFDSGMASAGYGTDEDYGGCDERF